MINITDIKDCCGCRACELICNHQAIAMQWDNEGFLYPLTIESKCVGCGLCERVCPMLHAAEVKSDLKTIVYAAQVKDHSLLMQSSSGGIFSLVAKQILDKNGVVYGAAFDDNMVLRHVKVDTPVGLEKLRGSKYLQSDIRDTFKLVKADLKDGKDVYFTGTPCQIAGLRLFLRKDYKSLFTSDLVCHGVPSQRLFSLCINQMEKERKGTVSKYSFRDKSIWGWSCSSSSSIKRRDKTVRLRYDRNMKAYFNAFIHGDLMRKSCYVCPYADASRVGDITIADFWGIEKHHDDFKNIMDGVSLLLVNTEKGRKMWDECSCKCNWIETTLDKAVIENHNLKSPTPMTNNREWAYNIAFSDYNKFINIYIGRNLLIDKYRELLRIALHNIRKTILKK